MDSIFEIDIAWEEDGASRSRIMKLDEETTEGAFTLVLRQKDVRRALNTSLMTVRGFMNADGEAVVEIHLPRRDEPIRVQTPTR
jgi:hypothetical protein